MRNPFGYRVDPTKHEIVKFVPTDPPRRGEHVLVDGVRHLVVYCRVRWTTATRLGTGEKRLRWTIEHLRVRRDP